jgi:protein tyrosine phosphatase
MNLNSQFEYITRNTIACSSTSLLIYHIFPAESGRPYLKHIDNVENSDYINACYVDVSVLMTMSF